MRAWLRGARLLLENGLVTGRSLLIEGGRIGAIGAEVARGDPVADLPAELIVAPGFVDAQANGGGGILFNDAPDPGTIARIAAAHRPFGTTFLLPTLITGSPDLLEQAVQAVRAGLERDGGPVGLHVEGPFINPARAGIHPRRHIRAMTPADVALLTGLAADRRVRVLLTLAPECCKACDIAALSAGGVIVAAGHTEAGPDTIAAAIGAGLRGFTHLFNAMPPLAGRAPGPVGAALAEDEGYLGIIADGVHVAPAALRLACRARPGRVFLVTDAMPPLGTDAGGFILDGRPILRRDGRLTAADGTLAGADLDMGAAVRNAVDLLGMAPADALRMASTIPAEFLRLDHELGRLAPGLRADLVVLSPTLHPLATCRAGAWSVPPDSTSASVKVALEKLWEA